MVSKGLMTDNLSLLPLTHTNAYMYTHTKIYKPNR